MTEKPELAITPELKEFAKFVIQAALSEDIGTGDITTGAIVKKTEKGSAEFLAKEDLVLAGLFVAGEVFKSLDKKTIFKPNFSDGDLVKKGSVIAAVSGRLDVILMGERVALNFLQRLSGIATRTNEFIKKMKSGNTRLLDTRKTTPCLRLLEKYAVKAGGGQNHRFGLYDCVLIKDNHIKAAGSITNAVRAINKKYDESALIEVEVTDLKEAREAVENGADIIMLDNMSVPMIKKALKVIDRKALVEVSGNISLDNIGEVSRTGVDFISAGALTHSARAVDISMKVVSLCPPKAQRSK